METSTILFYLIVGFICFEYAFSRILSYLNSKTWQTTLPKELEGLYDEEKYRTAGNYHQENRKMSLIAGTISTIGILLMLFFDGFALLDNFLRTFTEQPILLALAFFAVLSIISDILSLPFELYSTFVIEEKYGFNKTTAKTFITDKIKGYALGIVIGGAILALLIWFYEWAGSYFWVYAWAFLTLVSLFFATFATSIFLPIFNELKPLEAGKLRTAIEEYAQKVQFPLSKIMIMDGSKRSAKANAFFSGLGKQKSIVLFDTLVEKHETEELVAVLAHEVGHYKEKHIPKSMLISFLHTGLLLFLLNLALANPTLSAALGTENMSFHIGILAFSLLYAPISMLTGIFMNMYSRKNEYEADAYARKTYDGKPLATALKKLSVENLSNLTPHPLYVFMHYSHPTLLQRLQALKVG